MCDYDYGIQVSDSSLGIDISEIKQEIPTQDLADELNTTMSMLVIYSNCVSIGGKKYFFKQPFERNCLDKSSIDFKNQKRLITELLGEELSKYMGLDSIEYYPALLNGKVYGLISENFRKANVTYIQSDFLDLDELKYIRNALFQVKFNDENFRSQIARYLVRNIYSVPTDIMCNVLCACEHDKLSLATLYDYEESFELWDELEYKDDDLFEKRNINMKCLVHLLKNNVHVREAFEKIIAFDMKQTLDLVEEHKGILVDGTIKEEFIEFDKKRKSFVISKIKGF